MATGGGQGPHVFQPMPAPSYAAISSNNMATLLLTKADLEAAIPVLAALQEHRGPEFVSSLLAGLYVRIRRNGQPMLHSLLGLQLRPQGLPLLQIEGIAGVRDGKVLSHGNPFTCVDQEEYLKSGRQELLLLVEQLKAAGRVPGIDMASAAAAVWRKKVILGWAANWDAYLQRYGIETLATDLWDGQRVAQQAASLEAVPFVVPPPPALQQQPAPLMQAQPQDQQVPLPQAPQQHNLEPAAVQQAMATLPQQRMPQAAQQAQPTLLPQQALPAMEHQLQSAVQQQIAVPPAAQQPQQPVVQPQQSVQLPEVQPQQPLVQPQQSVQPECSELPPHLQSCQAPHAVQPVAPQQPQVAPQQPQVAQQQPLMGQAPHQPPEHPAAGEHHEQQQQPQPAEPQPEWVPTQAVGPLPARQPAQWRRAGSSEPPAAEPQHVPMRRHPGLAPWQQAADPALPPIRCAGQPAARQQSMPHMHHGGGGRWPQDHYARTGLLPVSYSGPPRLADLRSAGQGQRSPGSSPRMAAGGLLLSRLHAYGLPPTATHGQVATFFRASYPSVHSAQVVEAAGGKPHHAIVNFGAVWERDAALSKVGGFWFNGRQLVVRLPGEPLALPPQQAQLDLPEFKAYVNGLPPTMDEASAAAFFRRKYPSVLGVRLWPPARDQPATPVQRGHIVFASGSERDAAVAEMNGQFLEGQKLKVQLPLEETAAQGVQSPRSPVQQQQQQRPRDYNAYVAGLPADATDQFVADLFRQRYASVLFSRMRPPSMAELASAVPSRHAFVHFAKQEERDAAVQQMSGTVVGAHNLRVELPWAEQQAQHPAGEPAAAAPALAPAAPVVPEATAPPPAGPQFKLLVVNVGNAMPADQLAAYFRERYPSVLAAALRDGHGSVTFASDVERHRAKLDMDGHVLPGGRRIGTGLPPGTPAQPAPDAGAAAAAARTQPAVPTAPAEPAAPMPSGDARGGTDGGAAAEASPAGAAANPVASAPLQADADLPAAEQPAPAPAAAAPIAAAATGSAGSAAGQAPAPAALAAAAAVAQAGLSIASGSGQPPSAGAVALPSGLGPLQLVRWPAEGVPGTSFVLVPAAALAGGEGQAQFLAIPDSGASSGGLYLAPSTAQSLGVAGVLLPAQQLAAAATTAAPAGSSRQVEQGSGTAPSGGKQRSAPPKRQESGVGSHLLEAGTEPAGGGGRPQSRQQSGSQQRSRSAGRQKERSRSPGRRKRSSERRARRGHSRSRSRERRRHSRDDRSRSRGRRRRSPDDRKQRRSSPQREGRHGRGQERGTSSRQQRRSPEPSSKDSKRQHSSPQRDAGRRQRQRTPVETQQLTAAGQRTGPGLVTADSPGTRLVVVHRQQREVTPDVVRPVEAAAAAEAMEEEEAGTPDLADLPELQDQLGTAAEPQPQQQQQQQPQQPQQQAPGDGSIEAAALAAGQPSSTPQPASSLGEAQPDSSMEISASLPPPPPPSVPPSRPASAPPPLPPSRPGSAPPPLPSSLQPSSDAELPPLPPTSRPGSAQPPLPTGAAPAAAAWPGGGATGGYSGPPGFGLPCAATPAQAEWPGGGAIGGYCGPPGFGLPCAPGGQDEAAWQWAAHPDPLGMAGQLHGLYQPPPFLPAPAGGPPLMRRPEVPHVPAWACQLFLDAAHELAQARGLPLDIATVEVRMDRLHRRQFCLREAGVSIVDVCCYMEERELCKLRRMKGTMLITALR